MPICRTTDTFQKDLLSHARSGSVYAIFTVKPQDKSVIDQLRSDDLVGRQSIVVRDASSFGIKESSLILLLEGSEEAIAFARKIGGDKIVAVKDKQASELYSKIKEEESKADQGMGFLFG